MACALSVVAPTFFDKLVSKEIPASILYEDDLALGDSFCTGSLAVMNMFFLFLYAAFKDINPQGPIHFLVIPKNKNGLNRLSSATEEHIPLLGTSFYLFNLSICPYERYFVFLKVTWYL